MSVNQDKNGVIQTCVLPIQASNLGCFVERHGFRSIDTWRVLDIASEDLHTIQAAADRLRNSIIPVAFPTETVYGLGTDATRSHAVKGIYEAKGRPSDNPLIVHICDLDMLQSLLGTGQTNEYAAGQPIPAIYQPLIEKFWPGPLTILLPNTEHSRLAPEVTAGLKTVGVRMPDSPLALTLIKLAGVPIAAPSANSSTKPSPTTAAHVLHDLNGRIEIILDGGPCEVGVESTVVDGLCDPPVVLRPGGVSFNSIRKCQGWEGVVKGYKDESELGSIAPRAPGMKYKHYSPKAKVILFERSSTKTSEIVTEMSSILNDLVQGSDASRQSKIGIVRTRHWPEWAGWDQVTRAHVITDPESTQTVPIEDGQIYSTLELPLRRGELYTSEEKSQLLASLVEIELGKDTRAIAHGLFSALRELDRLDMDVIIVEGIEDEGDIAAAIMNRLRKAATEIKV